MHTEVHLVLENELIAQATALGPLDAVVERALRTAVDPAEIARRHRWAEDNALLVEAMADGAEELGLRAS
jgi:hypothetical protein